MRPLCQFLAGEGLLARVDVMPQTAKLVHRCIPNLTDSKEPDCAMTRFKQSGIDLLST
jgi:hypothetical protein